MLEELMAMFTAQGGGMNPALGQLLAQNPEAIIPHLSAQGVAPPPIPQGDGASIPPNAQPTSGPAGVDIKSLPAPGFLGAPTAREGDPRSAGQISMDAASGTVGPWLRGAWDRLTTMPDNPLGGAPRPVQSTLHGATAADADQGYDPGAVPPAVPMPLPNPVRGAGPPVMASGGGGGTAEGRGPPPAQAPGGDLMKALQGVKSPPVPENQRISSPSVPRPNAIPANNNLVQLLMQAMQGGVQPKNLYLEHALYGGRRP